MQQFVSYVSNNPEVAVFCAYIAFGSLFCALCCAAITRSAWGFIAGLLFGIFALVFFLCRIAGRFACRADPADPFAAPRAEGRGCPIRLKAAPRVFKMRRADQG